MLNCTIIRVSEALYSSEGKGRGVVHEHKHISGCAEATAVVAMLKK